jgi:ribosome-associated translation inhibitor RaiA
MESFQVRYQGLVTSDELRAAVERRAARLERFHERVAACRVAVQRWYQHHGQGSNYRVAIDLTLPGEELAIARESELDARPEALKSTLESAFEGAESALQRRAAHGASSVSHASHVSADARRLHPLHGRAPEDVQQSSPTCEL